MRIFRKLSLTQGITPVLGLVLSLLWLLDMGLSEALVLCLAFLWGIEP